MNADLAISWAAATPGDLAEAIAPLAQHLVAQIRTDAKLNRLVIPSMPDTVVAVRKVLRDPDASNAEVCRAMSRDPALAAHMLRVSNSVLYAGLSACNTLQSAVVRLGHSVVDNVMLVFTISSVFSVGRRGRIQPHIRRLWRHSARVAALSAALADCAPSLKRDVALLGGLIHDIGSVPVIVKAQQLAAVLDNPVLLKHLQDTLHAELGALVLKSWHGPPELVQVVLEHETIVRDGAQSVDYVDVVQIADILSHVQTLKSDTAGLLFELPASRKLGVDAQSLPEIALRAKEYLEGLNAGVSGA